MSETLNTTASSEGAVVEKVAKATAVVKEKKVKVKFLLSPTGKFNLGYNAGETASLPELQAAELIAAAYAELVK